MTPYERLRTGVVLRRAWAKVRESGLSSDSTQTRQDTRHFEKDWLRNLDRLSGQLRNGKFNFSGEKGITLSKGQGKVGVRPIVLAPIANRIVRRAVLEVLQGYGSDDDPPRRRWLGIPQVREVMTTRTSIGGIPERGVPHGLALVDEAVAQGRVWFVRSDIKNFFTKIPKSEVSAFIRTAANDDMFAEFFEAALATNLENRDELEERNHFKYFPNPEIGVAQGSALSALAGNIALRKFDDQMNDRGITCIRYIDDFILLGTSQEKVLAAYNSARAHLNCLQMDVYDLADEEAASAGKADMGNIFDGTDFLGYRISGRSLQPSSKSQQKLLDKIDDIVTKAKAEMRIASKGVPVAQTTRYHQAAVSVHETVWGWSQSFKYTTAKHVFEGLDTNIEKRIRALRQAAQEIGAGQSYQTRRRISGIHLLIDTPLAPLSGLLD